jgi:hypothetical protein
MFSFQSISISWDKTRNKIRSVRTFSKCIHAVTGSVVDIATAYELDGPGIECRWRRDFPAPVQTGPESHSASCTMGTGSFPEVRCGRA